MKKDDWKYYEDAWDDTMGEEKSPVPPEKQCPICLHWIDRDALYCSWCGKGQEEKRTH